MHTRFITPSFSWKTGLLLLGLACACSSSHAGGALGGGGSGTVTGTGGGAVVSGGTGGSAVGATGGAPGTTGGAPGATGGGPAETGGAPIGGSEAGSGGCIGFCGAGGTGGDSAQSGCVQDSDCGIGEIDHEILSKRDCMCLFGCAYLPQTTAVIARRAAQYQSLCNPGVDGSGSPCPVDECIPPPQVVCINHACAIDTGTMR